MGERLANEANLPSQHNNDPVNGNVSNVYILISVYSWLKEKSFCVKLA